MRLPRYARNDGNFLLSKSHSGLSLITSKGPNHSNHQSAKCQRLRFAKPSKPIKPLPNNHTADITAFLIIT